MCHHPISEHIKSSLPSAKACHRIDLLGTPSLPYSPQVYVSSSSDMTFNKPGPRHPSRISAPICASRRVGFHYFRISQMINLAELNTDGDGVPIVLQSGSESRTRGFVLRKGIFSISFSVCGSSSSLDLILCRNSSHGQTRTYWSTYGALFYFSPAHRRWGSP